MSEASTEEEVYEALKEQNGKNEVLAKSYIEGYKMW